MSAAEGLSVEDWQRIAAAKDEALEAIVRERNTWARQLADVQDELDAARVDRDVALEAKAEVENERTRLEVALEDAARDVREQVVDEVKRAAATVEHVHQIHGTHCVCRFASDRARFRTEHITQAVVAEVLARGSAS